MDLEPAHPADEWLASWRPISLRPADSGLTQKLRRAMDERVLELALIADEQRRRYWSTHHLHRGEDRRNRPRFGCRIRARKRIFAIEWFRYVPRGPGKLAYTDYFRRGRGPRYELDRFVQAPAWELTLIDAIETALVPVRLELAMIERIHRMLDASGQDGGTAAVKAKEFAHAPTLMG